MDDPSAIVIINRWVEGVARLPDQFDATFARLRSILEPYGHRMHADTPLRIARGPTSG